MEGTRLLGRDVVVIAEQDIALDALQRKEIGHGAQRAAAVRVGAGGGGRQRCVQGHAFHVCARQRLEERSAEGKQKLGSRRCVVCGMRVARHARACHAGRVGRGCAADDDVAAHQHVQQALVPGEELAQPARVLA